MKGNETPSYSFSFNDKRVTIELESSDYIKEIIETPYSLYKEFLPISKEGLYPYQLHILYYLHVDSLRGDGTTIIAELVEKYYNTNFQDELVNLIDKGLIRKNKNGHYILTNKGRLEIFDPDNKYVVFMYSIHCTIPIEVFALYIEFLRKRGSTNVLSKTQEEIYLTFGYLRVRKLLEYDLVLSAFEELLHLAEVAISIEKYGSACVYMAEAIKLLVSFSMSFEAEGTNESEKADSWDAVIEWRKEDVKKIMSEIRNKMDMSMISDIMLFHIEYFDLPDVMDDISEYDEQYSDILKLIGIKD